MRIVSKDYLLSFSISLRTYGNSRNDFVYDIVSNLIFSSEIIHVTASYVFQNTGPAKFLLPSCYSLTHNQESCVHQYIRQALEDYPLHSSNEIQ